MALQAFGKRLAQLRREKAAADRMDIDRRDVAEALGVSPSSVTRWEQGEVWPGEDTMTELAKYFGVSKSWLRYGEGAKLPPSNTEKKLPDPTADRPARPAAVVGKPRRR